MTLAEIAADMKRAAAVRPEWVRRELSRGLVLEYQEAGPLAVLVMSRPVVAPSEKEVAICRGAFGVPADAERADQPCGVLLSWQKQTIN